MQDMEPRLRQERENAMRVADRQTARSFLKYMDTAKTNYADTNERVASGKRFTRISDDVSSGTRALRIRGDMAKAEEHYDNVKTINEELTSTENAMTSISEIINKIHSKMVVKALNDPTGESGRKALANEIESMKTEILQFANSKYYNRYVLGGSSAETAPFSIEKDTSVYTENGGIDVLKYNGVKVSDIKFDDATSSYYYLKDPNDATSDHVAIPMDGDIFVDIGLGIRMNDTNMDKDTAMKISYSGLDILGFGEESTADGSVSNNIFNVISEIQMLVGADTLDSDRLKALDDSLVKQTSKFTANLTDIGAKTNFLDTIQSRLEDEIDGYQAQVKNVMGIDDAEEATKQTMNDYVLKAVLSMGSNIIPVSLMDYLK